MINDVLNLMIGAGYEAGEIVLTARDVIAESKSCSRDVVTAYDRQVQDFLVGKFGEALPGAHFFCEEKELEDSLGAEHVFIIDPIDGTMNFVRGFFQSCTSVAYMSRGEIKAGVVYNPHTGEMFSAVKGGGARLNGREIKSADAPLGEVVCCFGTSPYYPEATDETFRAVRYLFDNSLDIRREGSAAMDLCSIAMGRAGMFYETVLSFWDYAAGMLIASEAGARVCDAEGNPLPVDGRKSSVLAGTPSAVAEFLSGYKK